jgi:hypothetical protein
VHNALYARSRRQDADNGAIVFFTSDVKAARAEQARVVDLTKMALIFISICT